MKGFEDIKYERKYDKGMVVAFDRKTAKVLAEAKNIGLLVEECKKKKVKDYVVHIFPVKKIKQDSGSELADAIEVIKKYAISNKK